MFSQFVVQSPPEALEEPVPVPEVAVVVPVPEVAFDDDDPLEDVVPPVPPAPLSPQPTMTPVIDKTTAAPRSFAFI